MNAAVTEKTGTRKNISGFPLAEAKCKSWLNCTHHLFLLPAALVCQPSQPLYLCLSFLKL